MMRKHRLARCPRPASSSYSAAPAASVPDRTLDAVERLLAAGTSRRNVLKALLAAGLAPALAGVGGAAARAEEPCTGADCGCDCGDFACFLRSWGAPVFGLPNGVGAAADGTVYVAESPNRILHFDAEGTRLGAWGSEGSGPGEFISPTGVAVGPDGLVYVADAGNHRIQVFTAEGDYPAGMGQLRHG